MNYTLLMGNHSLRRFIIWIHTKKQLHRLYIAPAITFINSDITFLRLQGAEGDEAAAKALAEPTKYVLKPQREGGG